eukprot:CAMPEP_0172676238 /NCGR_PEP_ID=MMETSP1074-20121228/13826_1 /TAXON_ID=2916 /ORGANISM="Ceratium fusus, Strain PA161109" /LENGTH=201 /DNA_ID=CAMNT_0013493845 /DNA_START=212 /DNA_END=816 /DNA_ORIENTATION=+
MAQHLRMTPEHGASSTTGSVGKQALRSSEIAWASLHGSVNLAARNLMAVADLTDRGSASGAAESDATKKRMPRRAVRPPDTPRTGGAANVTGTKRGGVLRRPTLARLLSAHNIALARLYQLPDTSVLAPIAVVSEVPHEAAGCPPPAIRPPLCPSPAQVLCLLLVPGRGATGARQAEAVPSASTSSSVVTMAVTVETLDTK